MNSKFCEKCGKPLGKNKKFCNSECWKKYLKQNKSIELFDKVCISCGKTYKVHNYRIDSSSFCSQECHFNFKHLTKVCKYCGGVFSGTNWYMKNRFFCSRECSESYRTSKSKSVSKWEIDLYLELKKYFPDIKKGKGFKLKGNLFFVDLIYKNIIIECFGDYWHCNPIKYSSEYYHKQKKLHANTIWNNDIVRIQRLQNEGYFVLVLWENDYYIDKQSVIDQCLSVLNSNYFYDSFYKDFSNLKSYGFNNISNNQILKEDKERKMEQIEIIEVESLGNKDRGGIGSTGVK